MASIYCVLRHKESRWRGWMWLGSLALAGTLMSKISGYLVILPVALFIWSAGGPLSHRIRTCVLFLVPIVLVAVWRQSYMGIWEVTRPDGGKGSIGPMEALTLQLPGALEYLFAPWNLHAGVADKAPLVHRLLDGLVSDPRLTASIILGGAVLASVVLNPRPRVRLIVGALAVLVVVAWPALFYFTPTPSMPQGRTYYAMMAPLSFIVGVGFASLLRLGRPWRWTQRVFLVVIFSFSLDALANTASTDLAGGRRSWEYAREIERVMTESPEGALTVLIGSQMEWQGTLQTGFMTPLLFKRPFRARDERVTFFFAIEDLIDSCVLSGESQSIALLQESPDGILSVTKKLPALPSQLPNLISSDGVTWRPSRALPARAVTGLRISAPAGGAMNLEVRMDSDIKTKALSTRIGSSESMRESLILLEQGLEWLLGSRLEKVVVTGEGVGATSILGLQVLGQVPRVEVVSPSLVELWQATQPGRFCFMRGERCRAWRMQFRLIHRTHAVVSMTYCFAVDKTFTELDGSLSYQPEDTDFHSSTPPGVRLQDLGGLYARWAKRRGIGVLLLKWRIEALERISGPMTAYSDWRDLYIQF
jgi:hypothetical protein